MKIILFVTDLAVILGYNKYQHISDVFLKLYQKSYPTKYKSLIDTMEKQGYKLEPVITNEETIKNNGLDISKCLNSANQTELNKEKKALLNAAKEKEISEKDKEALKEAINRVSNTNFGINNETPIIEIYCKDYNKKLIEPKGFVKKKIETNGKIEWHIGGKVDGITEDKILVEVKNRVSKLFKELRSYERVQIQAYMYIFDLSIANLVEGIRQKKGTTISVIEDKFSESIWKDFMKDFEVFTAVFEKTIEDLDFMIGLLKEETEMRDNMLWKLINSKKEENQKENQNE